VKNYYFILGIHIYSREADIKSAYRKLALQFHPDRNSSPDAPTIFREVNEAYEVLSDPQRKFDYDRLLKGDDQPTTEPAPANHRDPRYRPKPPGFVVNRSSKKKELINLMQGYLPHALLSSRIALGCVFILVLDFVLPVSRKTEKLVGVYGVYNRYGQTGTELQAEDGSTYKLGKNTSGSLRPNDTVVICQSPLLAVPKRVETESGDARNRIPVSIYGNFIFFPALWLITSLLGSFYKKGIEFRFNLGVVNLLLGVFNLIMLLIS
jgi:curved DNA-binding protein CbpA